MWYLVDLLFTEPRRDSKQMYFCETCNVLFEAESSSEAYKKAIDWAKQHIDDSLFEQDFLGITFVSQVTDTPGDGVEVSGRFLRMKNPWQRMDRLVQNIENTNAYQWESESDQTIGEALVMKRGKQFVSAMVKAQKNK